MLGVLFDAKPKGHLICLCSICFMLMMGREDDMGVLAMPVKALGINPNIEAEKRVLMLPKERHA